MTTDDDAASEMKQVESHGGHTASALTRHTSGDSCDPTGSILEQRGEEAAAAESQRIQTKKRVHDAEPPGPPPGRQVGPISHQT